MIAQQVQEVDAKLTDTLRNFLFGPPGSGGLDLIALNIQRGRDMGLPSYNQARQDFGLAPVTSFNDISSSASVQDELASIYDSVDDIDLIVGGLAEDHRSGAMVGELFAAIIGDQFIRTRDGDRLWYENSQFTQSELNEIRSISLADLIRHNSGIQSIPDQVMIAGVAPQSPSLGGSAATDSSTDQRQFDGTGNNLLSPALGSTGQNLSVNYTLDYGDGINSPADIDRASARAISNAVFDQGASILNSTGATTMLMIWGQLLAHDLSLTPGGIDNTLKVHGDTFAGNESYPFVAEPLSLLFGREIYSGVNNVLARPIYLPALDTANAVAINPDADTMVTTDALPGVSVFVTAGTLQDREGNAYSGQLSITEVPRALTPASLPKRFLPDTVVTIQPAAMVFSVPAPMSFPNRAGYEPGTVLDLWSINPSTGEFEDVGDMRVSEDGGVVETVSGGVRSSSWHFPARRSFSVRTPATIPLNEDNDCDECKATVPATSHVELHSGAVLEDHDLATYQALGNSFGLSLHYDSLRADARPIIHFGMPALIADPDQRFVGSIDVTRGDLTFQVPGNVEGQYGLSGGEHFWNLDPVGLNLSDSALVALQVDFTDLKTGVYDYEIAAGPLQFDGTTFSGTLSTSTGTLRVVNSAGSPFGAGWGLTGLQEIVENPNGSVLLVDGGGSELFFNPSPVSLHFLTSR